MSLIEEVRTLREIPKPRVARAIRIASGVTQERLAAELGVHRVTLTRWESGERHPRGSAKFAYAGLLELLRAEGHR